MEIDSAGLAEAAGGAIELEVIKWHWVAAVVLCVARIYRLHSRNSLTSGQQLVLRPWLARPYSTAQ